MCGRYQVGTTDADIAGAFGAIALPIEFKPRYNVAPTDAVPVICNREGPRVVEMVRWGLIPVWAKDLSIGVQMINARSETIATKPAFRDAYKQRRCLVVADGFYEWKRKGKQRTPYRICRKDRKPFAFAGLWELWKSSERDWLMSCTVITCPPNALIEPLHDRMPVIVEPDDYERWLNPESLPSEALDDVLEPHKSDEFEMYRVSTLVNSVRNDSLACLEREDSKQQDLF